MADLFKNLVAALQAGEMQAIIDAFGAILNAILSYVVPEV